MYSFDSTTILQEYTEYTDEARYNIKTLTARSSYIDSNWPNN